MCGRFTHHTPPDVFARLFKARVTGLQATPRYNITPGTDILACRLDEGNERELVMLRWGLVPFWAKDLKTGYRMINARAETVAEKPAFRAAFRHRRCLIAADGFYEWQPAKPRKQPYYIRLKDARPFAFAGLWERWQQNDQHIESCTILVTDANAVLARLHDRMPVILQPKDYDLWLDPEVQDPARLKPLLAPYPERDLEAYPVGFDVNNPKNESAELIHQR